MFRRLDECVTIIGVGWGCCDVAWSRLPWDIPRRLRPAAPFEGGIYPLFENES